MRAGGNYRDMVQRKLIGSTVLTDYNNATYKISDIDWEQSPSSTFETRAGPVSFSDYYRNKYKLTIRDLGQPLLVSRATARNIRAGMAEYILLVPELCRATGITDEMRGNFGLMRDMSQHTRLSPAQRVDRLLKFNRRLQSAERSVEVFRQGQMNLDRNLVEFNGHRLLQETVIFGNNARQDLNHPMVRDSADWTQPLVGNRMFRAQKLNNWFYVYPEQCRINAETFMGVLLQAAQGLGMNVAGPIDFPIDNDRVLTYSQALRNIMKNDPMFIMVVVPDNRGDRYAAIKKETLIRKNPICVQVMSVKTMTPRRGTALSVATKVAIQVNCKLGGVPWMVDLRLRGLMIVGFDVSHDTNDRRQSYGAMVASLNPTSHTNPGGHYFSAINNHANGEQLSQHFGNNIISAIDAYCRHHEEGSFPERILIYRDGVGDGQVRLE